MGAYPNPSLYGEQYSFKPKGTPYHNGKECLFSIGSMSIVGVEIKKKSSQVVSG